MQFTLPLALACPEAYKFVRMDLVREEGLYERLAVR